MVKQKRLSMSQMTKRETIKQKMVEYFETLELTSEQAEVMQSTLALNLKQRNQYQINHR